MRVLSLYIVFVLLVGLSVIVLARGRSSEELIVGKWEEVAWQFEKIDANSNPFWLTEIDQQQKNEITRGMLIHEAEVWAFDKNKNLRLIGGKNDEENVNWKVKGRGNILELQHENLALEDFQIQEITEDSLIIHFNNDLQVKGIVKMIFKKVDEDYYAQKIQQ